MLEAYLVNRQWIAERLSHLSAPRSVSSSLKASQSITETREHQWSITSIARHHGCTENETLIRIRCQVTRQRSWHFACDYINFLLLPTPPRISDFCLCQRLFSFFAGLFLVRMLESLQIRAKYIWSFEHVPIFAHSILPFGVFMCILSISVFGPVSHRSSHNKTPTLPVHALGFGPEQGSCLSWEQGILVFWNSVKQKNQSITVDRKPETNIVRGSEQHPVTWTYLNIVQKWINLKRTSVKPKLVLTRV